MEEVLRRRPQEAARINVHEPWEINWWCTQFKCTKAQLENAVKVAGNSVPAVRKYFGH